MPKFIKIDDTYENNGQLPGFTPAAARLYDPYTVF